MAFDAFALILAMLALGMLFARLRLFPEGAAQVLNLVVLYVCLPAAVLTFVPRLHLDGSLLGLMLTPWLLMGAVYWLVALAGRALKLARGERAALLICVGFSNSSFIGYPMVRALLGDHALPYAVVYDQFGTFLMLSTLGIVIMARYSGETPPGPGQLALRVLKFPPLWALAFAVTLMPAAPPAWIASGLQRLADAMLPLVMLSVGLSIQLRLPRHELKPLAVGLALRLLVIPALAIPLSYAFGLRGQLFQVNVLESAMPTMITAAALAISHNLAPRLCAALTGYSIVLSLATLPLLAWLLPALAP
ncbi:AEC family transporter [Pseudoxanthomonas sp. X-1]|uniref:AEC family transporter n=1 Tax=Pseudoxanthomonas sp. X-1 TaxID=2571115 RepID=UPI00110A8E2A|nr:AEC family transporter [Pseudoxanthomonas sp. X-1]TMN17366.1 AEC family transporter [Pseudoxanthomonas sp. X-1]UAY74444.1 AEC family transporter [Pseudoxanthomonas sp. X-1]